MLDALQYAALKRLCKRAKVAPGTPDPSTWLCGRRYDPSLTSSYSKLDHNFPHLWRAAVKDRSVVDFGCGDGSEVMEIAQAGARIVYGMERSEAALAHARERITSAGLERCCQLLTAGPCDPVDVVFSFDSFEHFERPREILQQMYSLLKSGGKLYISFGPPWYHPLGGHAYSPFPWAHLLCAESALVRWRNLYFPGVMTGINSSGLNRMTIARFLSLCRQSPFRIERQEIVPIRQLKWVHNRLTRECTTAVVRVILAHP